MSIRLTQLDNGLRVATDSVEGAGSASIGLWLDRGSRHETHAQNGLAHLLEHMVFKGTRRRSARALAEVLENVGGHMNAYTSRETTAYYARVLSDHRALAVDVLTDLATQALLPEEDLEIERQIILSELGEMLDTPDDLVFELFQEQAFPDQGLGRSVLGRADVLESATPEDLRHFYSWMQNPRGLVLVGAGAVDHDLLVETAQRELGNLKNWERRTFAAPAYQGGVRLLERRLEQLHLVMGYEGADQRGQDFYVQNILATVLGGGTASRLFQEVREARGLAYSIGSYLSSYTDTGLFTIHASCDPLKGEALVDAIVTSLDRLETSLEEVEVARAKNQLKAAMLMSQESSFARAETLAGQLSLFGETLSLNKIAEQIDAVDLEQVREALTRLRAGPPTLAAVGTLHHLPPAEDLLGRLTRG